MLERSGAIFVLACGLNVRVAGARPMPLRIALTAVGVLGVLGGCSGVTSAPAETAGGVSRSHPPPGGACRDFEQDVERYWSQSSRAAVRGGILSVGGSVDHSAAERVVTKMDEITRNWVMMQESACKDCLEREVLSKEAYSKISACLRGTLVSQQLLASALRQPTAHQVIQADAALQKIISDLNECQREAVYSSYDREYAASDTTAEQLREALSEAEVLKDLESLEQARQAADRARELSRKQQDPKLQVDALMMQARVTFGLEQYAKAQALAEQAARDAKAAGYRLGEAAAWRLLGLAHLVTLAREPAEQYLQQALDVRQQLLGPEATETAISLGDIGVLRVYQQRYDEAMRYFQAKLTILESNVGSEDLRTLTAIFQIADTHAAMKRPNEALDGYAKVSRQAAKGLGPLHPIVADAAERGATVALEQLEQYDLATLGFYMAKTARQKVLGPEHPKTVAMGQKLHHLCNDLSYEPACRETIDPAELFREKPRDE